MYEAPSLVSEATARRDGINADLEATYQYIQIEDNDPIVIHSVPGLIQIPLRIRPLLQNIRTMIQLFFGTSIQHIFREGDMITDFIAKYGCVKVYNYIPLCLNFHVYCVQVL